MKEKKQKQKNLNINKKKLRDRLFMVLRGLKASTINFIKQLEELNLVVCTCDLLYA